MSVSSEVMNNELDTTPYLKRLGAYDWVWALMVIAGSIVAHNLYGSLMDGYEVGILYGTAVGLIWLGWGWKPMRGFSLAVALLSLAAIGLYGGELARNESSFFLKFIISSQSAIMWMSALYVMATVTYIFALVVNSDFSGKVASAMTWSATVMGSVGLMVRWRESYMMGADIGHIPVSNLYEVFILFSVMTALLYLTYERSYNNRAIGAFVLTVISAAVGFILWYAFEREAHHIQPLVPALQSYWMKIHVPANFVGYGAFALAAMLGVAYIMMERKPEGLLAKRLPSLDVLDDIMYKAIALGFAFFTVATVLGAMWAAEAWGGYWSWDPKETWALIVWLNYAAWLHLRMTKGWRGTPLAWWAVVGLFVTLFAFIGVNMFLSGLHSYGTL